MNETLVAGIDWDVSCAALVFPRICGTHITKSVNLFPTVKVTQGSGGEIRVRFPKSSGASWLLTGHWHKGNIPAMEVARGPKWVPSDFFSSWCNSINASKYVILSLFPALLQNTFNHKLFNTLTAIIQWGIQGHRSYFFFFFNFILFNFTILYWFCHISKWIRHRYTCVPHPEPFSLPIPSL